MAGGWFDLSGLLGYQRTQRIVGKPRRPPAGSYKAALTKLSRRGGGGAEAARRTTGARRPAAMHCQARSTPTPPPSVTLSGCCLPEQFPENNAADHGCN